jgi:hypothetical protein
LTEVEPLAMPKTVAKSYEALGDAVLRFAAVFRPDNGNSFRAMGDQLRELGRRAAEGELCRHRGLELFHSISSAGHVDLERLISWHRQRPERFDWIPYLVSPMEAQALHEVARALRDVDREVQESRWSGVGGGVRFTQTICSLEAIARPEMDLYAFNAGMGSMVHMFGILALYRS